MTMKKTMLPEVQILDGHVIQYPDILPYRAGRCIRFNGLCGGDRFVCHWDRGLPSWSCDKRLPANVRAKILREIKKTMAAGVPIGWKIFDFSSMTDIDLIASRRDVISLAMDGASRSFGAGALDPTGFQGLTRIGTKTVSIKVPMADLCDRLLDTSLAIAIFTVAAFRQKHGLRADIPGDKVVADLASVYPEWVSTSGSS